MAAWLFMQKIFLGRQRNCCCKSYKLSDPPLLGCASRRATFMAKGLFEVPVLLGNKTNRNSCGQAKTQPSTIKKRSGDLKKERLSFCSLKEKK
jgi:hypothetical protein